MTAAVTSMDPMTSVLTSSPVEKLLAHITNIPGFRAELTVVAKDVYTRHVDACDISDEQKQTILTAYSAMLEGCNGKSMLIITDCKRPQFLLLYPITDNADPEEIRHKYNHDMLLKYTPEAIAAFKAHDISLSAINWSDAEKSLTVEISKTFTAVSFSFVAGNINQSSYSLKLPPKPKTISLDNGFGRPAYFDDEGNFSLRALVHALIGDGSEVNDVPEMVSSSLYLPRKS